jgi:hypothetical protein
VSQETCAAVQTGEKTGVCFGGVALALRHHNLGADAVLGSVVHWYDVMVSCMTRHIAANHRLL